MNFIKRIKYHGSTVKYNKNRRKLYYILKKYFYFIFDLYLNNVMNGEGKMKSNFNFNFGVDNVIVWSIDKCNIE